MKRATTLARRLVKAGKPHELLPRSVSPIMLLDAQRYLSLYTPESAEEIFSYAHDKEPKTYKAVRLPVLTVFAAKDEYADEPAASIAKWFADNSRSKRFASAIIPRATHNFRGGGERIANAVRDWMGAL